MAENTKDSEEVIEEPIIEIGEDDSDNVLDFFADSQKPREGFEGSDEDDTDYEGEDEEGDTPKDEEQPTISQTNEEDEQYFKLAMSLLDSNRAMALSLYVDGDLENVDKFIYYKDWSDPKHKAILEAGRVVAKKYKFAAFRLLPEFAIVTALVVSTFILIKQAKKEKNANAGQQAPTAQPKQTIIKPLQPLSKAK